MKTRNGVRITQVSKYLTKWEDFMPNDISKQDVERWKQEHKEALNGFPSFMQDITPIDITYTGCYFADRCRKNNLLSEGEIQKVLFTMGRVAFTNLRGHWEYVMNQYNNLFLPKSDELLESEYDSDE
jgi:hypothetical protein